MENEPTVEFAADSRPTTLAPPMPLKPISAAAPTGVKNRFVKATNHAENHGFVADKPAVKVYMKADFLKIGEIDTVKEQFMADVVIQAKWREPRFDGNVDIDLSSIDWTKFWHPTIYVDNTVGDPKESIVHAIQFNADREAYVCERKRVKGTFLENLELGEFPFDTQGLSVTLVCERPLADVELTADKHELSNINKQAFVDEQEWNLYSNVETLPSTTSRLHSSSARERHSTIAFKCSAARRCGFYLWNIVFVMFFICSMTFTTFAVSYTLPQNRLQLTFILLLTTITFKFAVNQSLPKISYLTYMDKYILCSMTILCVVCVWHAIVAACIYNSHVNINTVFWVDIAVLVFIAFIYLTGHVVFFLVIVKILRKREVFNTNEKEYIFRTKTIVASSVPMTEARSSHI